MDGDAASDRCEVMHEAAEAAPVPRQAPRPRPADIAIIGMSAIMPGATDLRRFWENILDKVDSVAEVPAERWPVDRYFDTDRDAPDKINSKWGGFIPDIPFDPMRFGIPPASVPSIDPAQLIALIAAEAALVDAGLIVMSPDLRRRASVILAFTGGLGELGVQYAARAELARAIPLVPQETLDFLPRWTSDSFAGFLPNVVAGRIANRFDLGGSNFVVDAACASSLAALRQSVMELESGRSDVVLCGAVETGKGPFAFTSFSKAQALSPTGKCRAFDAGADGTAVSEGIAMLVLRRLKDAEAAGERVYAVIKGVDGSSDGRARGLMAPLPEGQKRALRRAYEQAGYSPASVALFEAHGTGTVAGDAAEIESLSSLLDEHGAAPGACAVGSVKTLIGHAEGAAGLAGLIKAVLGLHHRILPPHAGVAQPNPALRRPHCPIALHQSPQPWLPYPGAPRRAGVSAFGFGGANYHATLEEHQSARPHALRDRWAVELFAWRAADRAALADAAQSALAALHGGATPHLGGLSRALVQNLGSGGATLAIVAGSHAALATLLAEAVERLGGPQTSRPLPPGLFVSDAPLSSDGRVAMLFPGQGSQYPEMGRELATVFHEVAAVLADADAVLATTQTYRSRADTRLSRLVYPPQRFGDDEEDAARRALAMTDVAQPALGALEAAMLALTSKLGLEASAAAGHSYGEYVALHAAGVLSRHDLFRVSEARGRCIIGAARDGDLGTMAAVTADAATVRRVIGTSKDGIVIANINSPSQTVVSGAAPAIKAAAAQLAAAGIAAMTIPVSAAFHSPLVQPAQVPLVRFFEQIAWAAPRLPVYANTTAAPHDNEPARIRAILERHLTAPVDFLGTIEAMYAAGARVFLEIGPKSVLTGLTRRILGTRAHCAVALDGVGGGVAGLLHALAALMVQGVRVDLARLYEGRDLALVDLADWRHKPMADGRTPEWLVNGTRARRTDAPLQTAACMPTRAAVAGRAEQPVKESDMHGSRGPTALDDPDPQPSGVDLAMVEHQRTMQQFLQTQERLMMAYLGRGSGQTPSRPFSTPRPGAVVRPAIPPPTLAARTVAQGMPVAPTTPPAPLTVPPPATTSAPAPVPAADPQKQLLKIASERTGYPEDMLGLDLAMEADLGIDSIKRVEILGAFRKAQSAPVADFLQPRMTGIAKSTTLREVLDRVAAALSEMEGAGRPFEFAGQGQGAAVSLARHVMRSAEEPLPPGQPSMVPRGVYLVVPDTAGIATVLAELIRRDGAQVRIVPDSALHNERALDAFLVSVRKESRIRGVLGLASVLSSSDSARDPLAWRAGMAAGIKSLFTLLARTAPDLASDGIVVVVSAMGGRFGRDMLRRPDAARLFAGAGGGVGLIKSLAMEWPGCRCKAVDVDPDQDPAQAAAQIHAEIAAPVGRREVGYPAGVRTIFRTQAAPLCLDGVPIVRPDRDWVILAVGGARGITAETLRPFAGTGATCVVVGRTPQPKDESPTTVPLSEPGALRAHFLKEAATSGSRPTPAKIEARIAALLRDREIRANMADFERLGARIDYRICDVTNEAEVVALLEGVYARYGRLDGVLFGAGLIEDRLIVDKTRESLDRVFDTKVDGAFILTRHLRPQTLKFLALFTSVAGRYGNRGQTDYAAANEVLNRLAWQLQARFGAETKVTAVNWGPWVGTTNGPGMLTPETARQFRDRGLSLIEPREGRDVLWNELLYAPRDEVEIVAWELFGVDPEADSAASPAQAA